MEKILLKLLAWATYKKNKKTATKFGYSCYRMQNYRKASEALDEAEKMKIDIGEINDGYHTFNELYEFRKVYNACLFNEWSKSKVIPVHKSKKHFDGEECFGGGWFIVVAETPFGQVSNHYKLEDWDLFHVPWAEKSLVEFDGHTSKDVLERLKKTTDLFKGMELF